uniref:ATP synthase protein I n=1 Tax=uncultured Armatimonadetes bacterium TaxID=157466 RepID=A0A6J4IT81_9BACT|nr:hypothetical protein AVDCRST_MAG63-2483 [uncultured Armatimonadetes bacterium]
MSDDSRNPERGAGAAGGGDPETKEQDDLLARFPDPEADERLRVPRGDALPGVPDVRFERPRPRKPDAEGEGRLRLRPLGSELRGMGAASTVGITLVASIAIGAGLGWLVDNFLLRDPATPWGLIVGFLLGTASGFVNLVRVSNHLNRDD